MNDPAVVLAPHSLLVHSIFGSLLCQWPSDAAGL